MMLKPTSSASFVRKSKPGVYCERILIYCLITVRDSFNILFPERAYLSYVSVRDQYRDVSTSAYALKMPIAEVQILHINITL